jgi:predicted dehydrogenase
VYGDKGALEVYTTQGPLLYRNFGPKGEAKETPLKLPKVVHYPAMMRHLKRCMHAAETPLAGPSEGATLMAMLDATYKSAEIGRSVEVKQERPAATGRESPLGPTELAGAERVEAGA